MQELQEPSAFGTDGWGSGHVARVARKCGPVWYVEEDRACKQLLVELVIICRRAVAARLVRGCARA